MLLLEKYHLMLQRLQRMQMNYFNTILKLKPSSAKGTYMKSVYLSSTMSPSVQIDTKSLS